MSAHATSANTFATAQLAATDDVRTFGALGDGVADDTTAIESAIAALDVTGGVVLFTAGTYRITRPLLINLPGAVVQVLGQRATILVDTPTGAGVEFIGLQAEVSGLVFKGAAAATSATFDAAVTLTDCTAGAVTASSFEALPGVAVRVRAVNADCMDVSIVENTFRGCQATAVWLGADASGVFVHRVSVRANTFYSPTVPSSPQTRAIHVRENVVDTTISSNSMVGDAAADYSVGWRDAIMIGNSSATDQPNRISIIGNSVTGMADDAVGLSGCTNVIIQGNVLYGSKVTSGVYVPSNGTWANEHVSILGNVIHGHKLAGIFLKDTRRFTINGNLIYDCLDGITIVDNFGAATFVRSATISGNTIHSVGRVGIYCECSGASITANTIDSFGLNNGPTTGERVGIFLPTSLKTCVVSQNIVRNGAHALLLTGDATALTVTNNTGAELTGFGIYCIGFTGRQWVIANNSFRASKGVFANTPVPQAGDIIGINV